MRLLIIAGPPSAGKTSLVRQIVKRLQDEMKIAFLKIDGESFEDIELKKNLISSPRRWLRRTFPDHAGVMVMGDAVDWAESNAATCLS